jgi:putative nucleotidyltransferase with HDIG domain
MFKAIKRNQLKRRGLSCGRTRRKSGGNEYIEKMAESLVLRWILILGFMAGLGLLIHISKAENGPYIDTLMKAKIVAGMIFAGALVHIYKNHCEIFLRNSRLLLLLGLIFLQLLMMHFVSVLAMEKNLHTPDANFKFLLIPYAFAPMSVSILLGRNLGVFSTVFCSLWGALMVNSSEAIFFLISSLVCGFVAVYVTTQVRRRSRFIRAGLYVGMAVVGLGLLLGQIAPEVIRAFTNVDWKLTGMQTGAGLLVGIATATIVGGIIPVLESTFRITTDISWVEMSDLNHPLLKRLTLEAPGTYHHSLCVANLAEAAAEAVGANATMCRVSSYFHDIGKLVKPDYFIENITDGDNPHDDLTPTMSALIIIAHVKDGVDIALKSKLATEIIEIIEQHHGDSLVYFFYRRAVEQQRVQAEEAEEGKGGDDDVKEIREDGFRYPGPRPQFKESGIVSLADAVESATRSLQKPTPQKIVQTIDEIVFSRIKDGQLNDCGLTLQEINLIKESFRTTLRSMLHNRIAYPKDESDIEKNALMKKKRAEKEKRGKRTGALLP